MKKASESRRVGYFLSVNGNLDTDTKFTTRAKAVSTAMGLLKKNAVIGLVRANDKVLMLTLTPSKSTLGGLQSFQMAKR